jgi:dolichol-phosphate mannosyltransferase
MKTVVVIPTYNERENLEYVVDRIQSCAGSPHVLIVDDNSPDGTGALADELSRRSPGAVHVLHRTKKEGLGRAYVAGFEMALSHGYDVIVQMDADLSHDPDFIPHMLERIASCDLVLGSRYGNGIRVVNWDFRRLLLSKMATFYVQLVTGMPFTDTTGGFKCWRSDTLRAVEFDKAFSNGYLFQIEMTYRAYLHGMHIQETPIIFFERDLGNSKMSWRITWEAIWGVMRLKTFALLGRRRSVYKPSVSHAFFTQAQAKANRLESFTFRPRMGRENSKQAITNG